MQARYYDPRIGRFMSMDPVGFVESNPMSFNRYLYVNNNPYKYIDPTGTYYTVGYGDYFAGLLGVFGSDVQKDAIDGTVAAATEIAAEISGYNDAVEGYAAYSRGDYLGIAVTVAGTVSKPVKAATRGGLLPKSPTGVGSVPKQDRDPKRYFTPKERALQREKQNHLCGDGCGKTINQSNSKGHHIERHADGGNTVPENHSEVCDDCHLGIHSKDLQ
jgi:uncharacterized protein RhaS with RHS repeats